MRGLCGRESVSRGVRWQWSRQRRRRHRIARVETWKGTRSGAGERCRLAHSNVVEGPMECYVSLSVWHVGHISALRRVTLALRKFSSAYIL